MFNNAGSNLLVISEMFTKMAINITALWDVI
jgi:hypothetical protein